MKAIFLPGIGAAAALFLTVAAPPASAETYYRWVNERGYPVHSDRPPPAGTEYEVVSTGTNLMRRVEADEGAVPPEVEPRVGNDFEPENTSEQAQLKKKNPEYCQRARDNLQTLEIATRVRIRDEQGEYRFLTEEEKAAQKKEAQEMISIYCE